jgi:hypothetical protein
MSKRDTRDIVIAASALSTLMVPTAEAQDQGARKGVAGYVRGNVKMVKAGTTRAVRVRVGDSIFENQRIVTDSRSRMQLMMVDKSSITIGPNSDLTINQYRFDKKKPNVGQMVLSAAKGLFRFVGGLLSKRNPVRVKTPLATIGIRGAVAFVELTNNGGQPGVRVTFFYGDEVSVSPNGGGPTEILNQPGFQVEVSNDGQVQSSQLSPAAIAAVAKAVESTEGGEFVTEPVSSNANSAVFEVPFSSPAASVQDVETTTQQSENNFEQTRGVLEGLNSQGSGGGGPVS